MSRPISRARLGPFLLAAGLVTGLAAALTITGCSAGGSPDVATGPGATVPEVSSTVTEPPSDQDSRRSQPRLIVALAATDLPADLHVQCPNGAPFPAAALAEITSLGRTDLPDDDKAGVAEAMDSFLANEEGTFWPQDGWQVLHQVADALLLVHVSDFGDASLMTIERTGDGWEWAGASSGGPCPLQTVLPAGLGIATWRLDPEAQPLDADSTEIHVLVTERGCASAQPIGDRLIGPDLLITDDRVLLAFAVTPVAGAQECPGNPEQAVVVELTEPLGDREVVDGLSLGLDLVDFLD